MVGTSAHTMLTNPKFLGRALYFFFLGFGAFHLTRIMIAIFGASVLGKFGKPTLVRETSKLHTSNYIMIPYLYAKKFIH